MLVVNEKTLLIETIGATQELSKRSAHMDKRIARIDFTQRRVCVSAFIVIAFIALCVAGIVVFVTHLEDSKHSNPKDFSDFPYGGKWVNKDNNFLIDIVTGSVGSIYLNTSTWWYALY